MESNKLKRQLGVFQGAATIVGCMLGSGIFENPHEIFKHLQTPTMAVLAWIFGAFIAFAGSMTYAELCSRFRSSGSDAPFLSSAYSKPKEYVAYLFSWCRVFFINPGLAASVALTCSKYTLIALNLYPAGEDDDFCKKHHCARNRIIISCSILFVYSIIIISSNRISAKISSGLVFLATSVVLIFGISGIVGMFTVGNGLKNFTEQPKFKSINPSGASMAFTFVMWAYDGWSNLASVSGEISNPESVIPKASLIGIITVSLIYIVINIGLVGVVPWEKIMNKDINLSTAFATQLFGDFKATNQTLPARIAACFVIVCTLSCLFMTFFSVTRITQATGLERRTIFPDFFQKINNKLKTPVNSVIANFVLTCILVIVLTFAVGNAGYALILDMVSYQFWLFCGLSCLGLLIIRHKRISQTSLKVSFIFPVFVILCVLVYLIAQIFSPSVYGVVIAVSVILIGNVPYFLAFDPNQVRDYEEIAQ